MRRLTRPVWLLPIAASIALAPATSAQQSVFRGETNALTRRVTVRDARGQSVSNLRPDEFEIYEDGVLQTLVSLEAWVGGRQVNAGRAPTARAVSRDGLVVPPRAPEDAAGRIFIVFIDDLHFEAKDSIRVRRVMKDIEGIIHDNDLVGILSSGYSSLEYRPAYDYQHKRLEEAITKTMGSGMGANDIITSAQSAQGPVGIRFNAHVAMGAAIEMIEGLASITDRSKSFLYVSAGYDFDPYKDARLKHQQELYGTTPSSPSDPNQPSDPSNTRDATERKGNEFSEADLVAQMSELIRAANRANVVIYTIDPRGLVAGPDITERLSAAEFRDHLNTSINSLMAISENTGGRCLCGTNDYKRGLEQIDNETGDYYMLGYTSTNRDPTKLVRRVEIRLKRPSVTAKYQQEYTLKRAAKNK